MLLFSGRSWRVCWAFCKMPSQNHRFIQHLFPLHVSQALGEADPRPSSKDWPQWWRRWCECPQEAPHPGDVQEWTCPQVKGQGRSGCRGGGRGLLHVLPTEGEAKSQGRQSKRMVGCQPRAAGQARPKAPPFQLQGTLPVLLVEGVLVDGMSVFWRRKYPHPFKVPWIPEQKSVPKIS